MPLTMPHDAVQMSTGMPVEVLSAKPGQSFISYYKLDIDIHKCAPLVAWLHAERHFPHRLPC